MCYALFVHGVVIMTDASFNKISRKTWYRWSIYINLLLFFIVALFITLLLIDSFNAGRVAYDTAQISQAWTLVVRDIAFLSVALALVFFQFFKNLTVIIRRSL